jgi:spermidine synthase
LTATATPATGPTRIALWLATAAIAGAVVMALELVSFRLYAPYFGNSIYVWGSMISVVMLALSVGYAVGGWVADRSDTDVSLYGIILCSAFYQLAIVLTVRAFLPSLAQYGEFDGPVLATLIIFAPPTTALAAVGPFVVRLLARAGHIGSTAGRVYALSTVGGVAGILGTVFFLVPQLGTQATLTIWCATSALVGVAGLVGKRRLALLGLLPLSALAFVPQADWSGNAIWVRESPYNVVRVLRRGNRLMLVLNAEGSIHTIRDEASGWTGYYYDDFALGPLLVEARRALVLGMGGGGSITSTRAVAPEIEVDAVEIDPEVVEAGRRFFGMQPDERRLRIHVADARPWLAQHHGIYDLVHVDLYQGGPYIPFYLVTVEFFELVRQHMSEDGLLMMHVFDAGPKKELLQSTGATLLHVFPSVAVLLREDDSYILLAFSRERSAAWVRDRLQHAEGTPTVKRLARKAVHHIVDLVPLPGTLILTDDYAPVEDMTRRMMAKHWARLVGAPQRGKP